MRRLMVRLYIAISVAALSALALFAVYRVPSGPEFEIIAVVTFQMLDLGLSGPLGRGVVEFIAGNERQYLESERFPSVYLSASTREKIWKTPPDELLRQKKTIRVTCKVRNLWFSSGLTPASCSGIVVISGIPHITK